MGDDTDEAGDLHQIACDTGKAVAGNGCGDGALVHAPEQSCDAESEREDFKA